MNLKELESQIAELNLKKQELLKKLDEQKDREIKEKLKEIKPVTNHYTLTFTVNVTERLLNTFDSWNYTEYDVSVKGASDPGKSPVTKSVIKGLADHIHDVVAEFVNEEYDFGNHFSKAAEKHFTKMNRLEASINEY